MPDLNQAALDAARDAARPYAANIAEEVITHLARVPAGYNVPDIIGTGLANAVRDALTAALPHLAYAAGRAAGDRIVQLEALATETLASYHRTSDGYRGRVGQVQIAKWQAVLNGTAADA